MTYRKLTTTAAVILVTLLMTAPAPAETIQADGADFLGFEAENFDANEGTINDELAWKTVDTTTTLTTAYGTTVLPADTNASGGTAMYAPNANFRAEGKLTYNLTFKTEGTYYGYIRYSFFENGSSTTSYGNEDSIFVSDAFGQVVDTDAENTFDLNQRGIIPASGEWEGTYRWQQIQVRVPNTSPQEFTDLPFEVLASDLNQPVTFQIGTREGGVSVDYIVFSTNDVLSDSELDQLMAVPEPSTMMLLVVGLAVAAGCFRRRARTVFWAVLALGLSVVSPAVAETIQADGADFLGFEADQYDAMTDNRWLKVDTTPTTTSPSTTTWPEGVDILPNDTNAFGGDAMLTDFSGTEGNLTYNVTFKTAGTYYGYIRYSMFECRTDPQTTSITYGEEDSVYLSRAFGESVTGANGNVMDLSHQGSEPASGQWEGTFRWERMHVRPVSGSGSEVLLLDVAEGDLDTSMIFEIRNRESGVAVDYLLFSTDGTLTADQLDQLAAVPEPSSMVLLAVGLLAVAGGLHRHLRAGFFAVLALALLTVSPVAAETIQADGADFLGFEAEDFDTNEGTSSSGNILATGSSTGLVWQTVDTASPLATTYGSDALASGSNASGGAAMLAAFNSYSGILTYNLTFKTAETYYGYVRYSMFEDNKTTTNYGEEDSMFVSSAFKEAVGTANDNTFDFDSLGHNPASGEWEGTYRWQQIRVREPNEEDSGYHFIDKPFEVLASDLNQSMTFQIGSRESGASIDYVLFSTNSSLSDVELDQLMAVPEPSSLVLLIVGLVLIAGRLRRMPG